MIKPGYRTSEFWFTLVSFLFSGLYLLGIINDNGQKEDLIRDVSHGVESAILIGGQLAILWKYINSRKQIKQTWWSTASPEERIEANIKNSKGTKNESVRSTKTRARKSSKRK
jgi:hypothetical protein